MEPKRPPRWIRSVPKAALLAAALALPATAAPAPPPDLPQNLAGEWRAVRWGCSDWDENRSISFSAQLLLEGYGESYRFEGRELVEERVTPRCSHAERSVLSSTSGGRLAFSSIARSFAESCPADLLRPLSRAEPQFTLGYWLAKRGRTSGAKPQLFLFVPDRPIPVFPYCGPRATWEIVLEKK